MIARNLLTFASVLCAAALTPAPALATPPDVVNIREEPFGLSQTHLFVVRTSDDNMGLYESLRVESFLVAIDLKTGAEEIWLLDRLRQDIGYDDDGESIGPVTRRDESSGENMPSVNPYAILAKRDGLPWAALSVSESDFRKPATVIQDYEAITASHSNGRQYSASMENVGQYIANVGAMMAQNVADAPRMSTMSTKQMFADRAVDLSSCKAKGAINHWQMQYPAPHMFVRVTYRDGDDLGITSIIARARYVEGTGPQ